MSYTVIWSDEAKTNYKHILEYLNTKWTHEVTKFAVRTEEAIALIKADPHLYKSSTKSKTVRQCILVKQVSIFYKIEQNAVYLIAFWDNRQNPKRLKY